MKRTYRQWAMQGHFDVCGQTASGCLSCARTHRTNWGLEHSHCADAGQSQIRGANDVSAAGKDMHQRLLLAVKVCLSVVGPLDSFRPSVCLV